MTLPTDYHERKAIPLYEFLTGYFPDAIVELVKVSVSGNAQHNPGERLHWARHKSTDQLNTAQRHLFDHAVNPRDTDGQLHLAKAAWRLLAQIQLICEEGQKRVAYEALTTGGADGRVRREEGCDAPGSGEGSRDADFASGYSPGGSKRATWEEARELRSHGEAPLQAAGRGVLDADRERGPAQSDVRSGKRPLDVGDPEKRREGLRGRGAGNLEPAGSKDPGAARLIDEFCK